MTRVLDLRLVPAALLAWAAALLVVRVPATVSAAVAVAAVLCIVPATCRRRRAVASPRADAAVGTLALALGAAVAVLVAGAAQQQVRAAGPFGTAVARGWTVQVQGVLSGSVRPVVGGACRYPVAVRVAVVRGAAVRAAAPVDVVAPCVRLEVGARLSAAGRLAAQPARRAVATLRSGAAPRVLSGPTGALGAVASVRTSAAGVAAGVPGAAGELLPAIAWGDTSRVSDTLARQLQVAGLTHVMAVSGAHFAIVAGLVARAASGLRLRRGARALAVGAAAAALVLLVHAEPSVLRAAVMGAVGVAGLLVGRPARGPAALAATVVLLLVADPWLAGELGFVLSVSATAGIVVLAPVLVAYWSGRLGRGPATALAAPLVAQLACAPVLLGIAPGVATWALPANLVAAPAVGPATVLGLAAALLAPVWPAGASWLADGAGAACRWITQTARLAAAAPAPTLAWWPGWLGALLLAGVGAAVLGLLLRGAWAPSGRLGACPSDDDQVRPP